MNTNILEIESISFAYDDKTTVFDQHSLTILPNIRTGLYGLIGPSGTGKTTLVSIIGGQLHPPEGKVLIDGAEVYSIRDTDRRQLIAIQLQSSTALRGSLRYNLLFGIPENDETRVSYADDRLIEILQQAGLWEVFLPKEGLDTLIGEGGMNLSGGQRQRLNFVALYLRAKYFQPKVILIDEPTSSLDEISELAITAMMEELSKTALTIVVAHRLKTLEKSQGLIDSSLFAENNQIQIFSQTELLEKSQYYRDLLAGKAQLDQ